MSDASETIPQCTYRFGTIEYVGVREYILVYVTATTLDFF